MAYTSWRQWLKASLGRVQGHRPYRRTVTQGRSFVPRLEGLEDRIVPSTLTVVNNHDSGSGSLRAILASAKNGDTIVFAKSVNDITLTTGELLITDSVTINGPGANQLTISGNDASRVFEIAASKNVTISGLTITDGYALDTGGGILNDGSNLTLSRDDLIQNVTYEGANDLNGAIGGAIDSLSGNLNIASCTIANNRALGGAGADASGAAAGGGINVQAGSLTIGNSTIQGNLAQGGANSSDGAAFGGAIQAEGTLVITNSTISDNQGVGGANSALGYVDGGGILVFGSGTLTMTGSTFSGNSAVGGDGTSLGVGNGVLYTAVPTTITNCTLSGNSAIGGNDCTGVDAGQADGGALLNYGSTSISGCTFDQNLALAGNGGNSGSGQADPEVDASYGGAINNGASINVTNSSFRHNEAIGGNNATATGTDIIEAGGAEGGAFYNGFGAAAVVAGCTFDHNQAVGGNGNTGSGPVVLVGEALGGAIVSCFGGSGASGALGPNTLTVSNSTLTQNNVQGGDNNTGTASVAGFVGCGLGAGIANYLGGSATVRNSELDNNQALGGTGNTANTGLTSQGGEEPFFADLGAAGGIFNDLGNYESSGYGQLNNSVLIVSNSTFADNLAVGGLGGGIWNQVDATATVDNCTFTSNRAIGVYNAAYPGISAAGGGGIENEGALTVSNGKFIDNVAIGGNDAGASGESEGAGGGIDSGDITPTGSLYVTNSTFAGNLGVGGNDAGVSLGASGALTAGSPTDIVIDCTFTDNQALGGPVDNGVTTASQGLGGAINAYGWSLGFTVTVNNSTFTGNEAIGGSGATTSSPYGPSGFGGFGGAIEAYYGLTITVTNSTFSHNDAIGGSGGPGGPGSVGIGGALDDSQGENLILSGSSFSQNAAIGGAGGSGAPGGDGVGGAVSIDTGATATITDTNLDNNQALGGAGGAGDAGGNGWGGGLSVGINYLLFTGTDSVTLISSTISNNSATGGDGGSGGNGSGGGVFIGTGSSLDATASKITQNDADGGKGKHGGADGTGIGGGIYNLGTFTDVFTIVKDNHASTSDDNIGP